MILAGGVVSQDGRLLARIEDHHVDVTVVVQVVEPRAAAAQLDRHSAAAGIRDVDEPALAGVHQQHVADVVGRGVVVELDIVLEVAAGDVDVAISVVVEIDEAGSPVDVGERPGPGLGAPSPGSCGRVSDRI